ncbi:hypothetical protein HK099_006903 [Clydaea vesicula]|uniref:C2H2-type domain-containing protein n=1 Tax=Clydaea vesicula TaxID=447962 RepID=A0AAD5XXY4_9FUNG|nr:hypothetical protein HK099_006903 [Clydaea vesicula]KAJ3378009.1 hypothetical protein HDU92_007733 [Lobulomyces angularis]
MLCRCLWLGCKESYRTEDETYEHCYTNHITKGKQVCQWVSSEKYGPCMSKMQHRGALKDHLISHFSFDFRPVECPVCPKKLRNRQELNRHIKTHEINNNITSNNIKDISDDTTNHNIPVSNSSTPQSTSNDNSSKTYSTPSPSENIMKIQNIIN